MTGGMFDVLMYMYENYEAELQARPEPDDLHAELERAGFAAADIRKAFDWLDVLADQAATAALPVSQAVRVYTDEECVRLDVGCRGFLHYLEQNGVLDAAQRERVIERALAIEDDTFDLTTLKWVTLLILSNQPGQEAAHAWMQDLLYDQIPEFLH
jgi:Smg protein